MSLWHYRLYGPKLTGHASDTVWHFAYGSNMHDGAFLKRRRMRPIEWRVSCLKDTACASMLMAHGKAAWPIFVPIVTLKLEVSST